MFRYFLAISVVAMFAGCATYPEEPGGAEFGSAVRHMIEAQTYAPVDEVPTMLGDKAAATMDVYRNDVAKPEDVSKDLIQIQVGK